MSYPCSECAPHAPEQRDRLTVPPNLGGSKMVRPEGFPFLGPTAPAFLGQTTPSHRARTRGVLWRPRPLGLEGAALQPGGDIVDGRGGVSLDWTTQLITTQHETTKLIFEFLKNPDLDGT